MKSKFISIIFLILLLVGISNMNGIFAFSNKSILDENVNIDESKSSIDVEREIQPIDIKPKSVPPSTFQPSPLSVNNLSKLNSIKQSREENTIVNIDLEKQVLTTEENLSYVIQVSKGFNPLPGESYTLDIIEGEYWGWYFYWLDDYREYEDRIIYTRSITTDPNGLYKGQFDPPGSGRYSLVVRSPSSSYALETRTFTVADIALFWRVSREFSPGESHYSVAYVLNTTDFSPVSNADIKLSGVTYEYNDNLNRFETHTTELFTDVTNDQGIVDIEFTPPLDISSYYHFLGNLSATYNGETVYVSRDIYRGIYYYWDWYSYNEYEPYEFIITTDKPIYSPGETIQMRVLLWKNDYLKVIKEPFETSFILKILTPSQYTLVQREVKTNSYGIATYSFTLDIDSGLGNYRIVAQKEETLSSLEIRVDKYEKPAYRVELSLDREYVAPGNIVSGNVTAEFYFGKPVSDGEVELTIGTLEKLTGVTDINGYWEFKYRLPSDSKLEEFRSIPLNVTVTDTVGREVTNSALIQISKEVYAWAYVSPWFPKLGENITVYFGAYQYSGWGWWDWSPLTNAKSKIEIYGITDDEQTRLLKIFNSQTDANGRGQLELDLLHILDKFYLRFKGIVEIDAGDGREGSSTFYFSIDRNSVEISTNQNYQPGNTIQLKVNVKDMLTGTAVIGNVKIRIFDSEYDQIGETFKVISTEGGTLHFKLSPYAPNGKYVVYAYLETTFDSEWGSWTYYRYSTKVEFFIGSSYEITLESDQAHYSLSDKIIISGHLQGATNIPLMIQFVKKGIVTTEFVTSISDADFSIKIEDIGFLAPQFWVFAFAILEDGTILESSLHIKINSEITVEVRTDNAIYDPGDLAKIEITVYDSKHEKIPSILAISFIDSSVFGVQPDPENEQEHFTQSNYWPSVWTVSSWKSRQNDWWFWWYDDIFFVSGGYWALEDVTFDTPGQGFAREKSTADDISDMKKQKIRDNLPENAYWKPQVIVENGHLSFELILPDTIGEWTVRVVTTTSSGLGILHKHSFKTFLPFFVEIEKDPFVLQDDVFVIKGIVYNYLDEILDVNLEIETGDGIFLIGKAQQALRLPPSFLGAIGWASLATEVGFFNITIHAQTTLSNGTAVIDALRKPLEVVPNGIVSVVKQSGFINDSTFLYVNHAETIHRNEFLELSLGLGSVALSSWERLVRYPYGCTEQTISRLIPNALVLAYLNTTGQLDNDTEVTIRDMISSGISRIYSQRHSDGGWGWWYSDSSRVYMTSLVLYGLRIVNETGFYVDSEIINDALNMLIDHQNLDDGSWTPDSWRNIDKTAFTTFVLRSIISWDDLLSSSFPIIEAISYIESTYEEKQSPYLAGIFLESVKGTNYSSTSFTSRLITDIINEVQLSTDGYYFWTYSTDEEIRWRALGGDVEITALALKALYEYIPNEKINIIRSSLQWLLRRQYRYGWGNTADTAAAISAIVALSQNEFSSDEDAEVKLIINDQEVNYNLSLSNQSSYYINIEDLITQGSNEFKLTKKGNGSVSYYFYGQQTLRELPKIDLPSEIRATPGGVVHLEIEFKPKSSLVWASNIEIKPLEGEIRPIDSQSQTIDQLTQETTVAFSYNTPSVEGTYEIQGFEIAYQLSDQNLTQFSPGIISRKFGPIKLHVSESTEGQFISSHINSLEPPTFEKKNLRINQKENFVLTREYSETSNYQKGDLVFVSLTITNNLGIENFIMLEDAIPTGFVLDENTIQHSAESYQVTSSGITFFFPELDTGTIEVKYGLIAMNVRQSLVSPAKLSNMYDVWEVFSSSAILGETRIPVDPKTGDIVQDLQVPILNEIIIDETIRNGKASLSVTIQASDNWGIASVRLFIKQTSWQVYECTEDSQNWKTSTMDLREGQSRFYVEIIDVAGNVLISESVLQFLEFQDLVIPFIPILALFIFALVAGIAANVLARKKRF